MFVESSADFKLGKKNTVNSIQHLDIMFGDDPLYNPSV